MSKRKCRPPARCFALLLLVFLQLTGKPFTVWAFCDCPDIRVEAAFAPKRKALELVLCCINEAEREILIAGYSFTSKPVAEALLAAHRRGVTVRVLVDEKSNRNRYTAATFLSNHGVQVRYHGKYAIMHNKFMIIDRMHVQTGSFNYSAAAAKRNAENVLVLKNSSDVARLYIGEWNALWKDCVLLSPSY